MIFESINRPTCIVQNGSVNGSGGTTGNDPRCSDGGFAAAHPDICGTLSYLVIRPSSSIITKLGLINFTVFEVSGGSENEVVDNLNFTSSNNSIFTVGINSGYGTGVGIGDATVTVTRKGKTASASVRVLDPVIGCTETVVATSILIDNSKSMTLGFGGAYPTRLDFAAAIATSYSGRIAQVNNAPKDSVKIWSFNDTPTQVSTDFLTSTTQLASDISTIDQTLSKTNLAAAITAAANDLISKTADVRVLLVISDGEETDAPTEQDVLDAGSQFKAIGGIIICIGCRSAMGFDLLDRLSTGGFFLNGTIDNVGEVAGGLSYLKSLYCAGTCTPIGDTIVYKGAREYSSYKLWSVTAGETNLIGAGVFSPVLIGNGLAVQMAANQHPAALESIDSFQLVAGHVYHFRMSATGNNIMDAGAEWITVLIDNQDGSGFVISMVFHLAWNEALIYRDFSFTAGFNCTSKIIIQFPGPTGTMVAPYEGPLIDNILFEDTTTLETLLNDNFDTENATYVPPPCGPNSAVPESSDPPQNWCNATPITGGSMSSGDDFNYAFSYQTAHGETNISSVCKAIGVPTGGGVKIQVVLPADDRVTAIRLWRNVCPASPSNLRLLATMPVNQQTYLDFESCAEFTGRVDDAIVPPVSNTTAVAQGALGYGTDCTSDECNPVLPDAPQVPDPFPLADVENGVSVGNYTSTTTVCGTCQSGWLTSSPIISDIEGGSLLEFWAAVGIGVFTPTFTVTAAGQTELNLTIKGSEDGVTWTTIKPEYLYASSGGASLPWAIGTKLGAAFPPALVAYKYFQLLFDTNSFALSDSNSQQVCKSGVGSGSSQGEADNNARNAAQAALNAYLSANCAQVFKSTQNYTAVCPCGQYGPSVVKSAIGYSFSSQIEADQRASAAAQLAANSALDCTQSNNSQVINIPSSAGNATPYPSVKYVPAGTSGTTIRVRLNKISTRDLSAWDVLLISPSGKACALKCNAGQPGGIVGVSGPDFGIIFDDASELDIPSGSLPSNGGSYRPTIGVTADDFTGCAAEKKPWETTLSALASHGLTGSWSLWVRSTGSPFTASIGSWDLLIT